MVYRLFDFSSCVTLIFSLSHYYFFFQIVVLFLRLAPCHLTIQLTEGVFGVAFSSSVARQSQCSGILPSVVSPVFFLLVPSASQLFVCHMYSPSLVSSNPFLFADYNPWFGNVGSVSMSWYDNYIRGVLRAELPELSKVAFISFPSLYKVS